MFNLVKVIIPAAGYGTRLQKAVKDKPKALVEVAQKPVLSYLVDKINKIQTVDEIIIITNDYFHKQFLVWKENISSKIPITLISDGTKSNEERLGTVADLSLVIKQKKIDEDILIIGSDNLFEDELDDFIEFFKEKGSSILLYDVKKLEEAKLYGVVDLNKDGKIINFLEKPKDPPSTLIATLLYAIKKEHLKYISLAVKEGFADRAGDFMAYLSSKKDVFGLTLKGKWYDIGTPSILVEAEEFYSNYSNKIL